VGGVEGLQIWDKLGGGRKNTPNETNEKEKTRSTCCCPCLNIGGGRKKGKTLTRTGVAGVTSKKAREGSERGRTEGGLLGGGTAPASVKSQSRPPQKKKKVKETLREGKTWDVEKVHPTCTLG